MSQSMLNRASTVAVLVAACTVSVCLAQGQKDGQRAEEKTHSEKMKAATPEALPSDIGDRVHDRLFEVESQIATTRTLIQRLRSILTHRAATEEDAKKLAYYNALLGDLGTVRTHLAALHVHVAECTAACAKAEEQEAGGDSALRSKHHESMVKHTKAAGESLAKLHDAVGSLGKRRVESDDKDLGRLVEYLTKECEALGAVVVECQAVIDDAVHEHQMKLNADKDGVDGS